MDDDGPLFMSPHPKNNTEYLRSKLKSYHYYSKVYLVVFLLSTLVIIAEFELVGTSMLLWS
jgi:hypothetical protein